jgi:hypothetical protein
VKKPSPRAEEAASDNDRVSSGHHSARVVCVLGLPFPRFDQFLGRLLNKKGFNAAHKEAVGRGFAKG